MFRTQRRRTEIVSRGSRPLLWIRTRLFVERTPEVVWRALVDLDRWGEWSPLCRRCRLAEAGELGPGAEIVMRLDFRLFATEARARITRLVPGRRIRWRTGYLGARFVHEYRLQPLDGGTLLSNRELVSGLGGPVRVLVRRWFRATDLSVRSLEGLKRLAEAEPRA